MNESAWVSVMQLVAPGCHCRFSQYLVGRCQPDGTELYLANASRCRSPCHSPPVAAWFCLGMNLAGSSPSRSKPSAYQRGHLWIGNPGLLHGFAAAGDAVVLPGCSDFAKSALSSPLIGAGRVLQAVRRPDQVRGGTRVTTGELYLLTAILQRPAVPDPADRRAGRDRNVP